MKARNLLVDVSRALRWHRRKLAVACTFLAVLAGLSVLSGGGQGGIEVLVTTRAIPGGQRLTADDVTRATVPKNAVPADYVTPPGDLEGRILTISTPANTIIVPGLVMSGEDLSRAGLLALPVPLNAAAGRSLIRVGDRIDLLGVAPGDDTVSVIARQVRVLALPASTAESGPFASTGVDSTLVLLEVTPEDAARISGAAAAGSLSFALR